MTNTNVSKIVNECNQSTKFFPSMFFCGEATKKASIDGLKWRDLVMGRWWLVNFKVSAVRCPVSQRVSCVKLRKAGVAM